MKIKAKINDLQYLLSGVKPLSDKYYFLIQKLEENDIIIIEKQNKKRSLTQNNALHLFFEQLANEFNNLGITFNYSGIDGEFLELPYTGILVKETLWKPIQKALFETNSTTELETYQINKILDVLINFFAEKGIQITFPNQFDLYIKQLNENNNGREKDRR